MQEHPDTMIHARENDINGVVEGDVIALMTGDGIEWVFVTHVSDRPLTEVALTIMREDFSEHTFTMSKYDIARVS